MDDKTAVDRKRSYEIWREQFATEMLAKLNPTLPVMTREQMLDRIDEDMAFSHEVGECDRLICPAEHYDKPDTSEIDTDNYAGLREHNSNVARGRE